MAGVRTRRRSNEGNRNALRHGLRAGKLPKGCKHIEIQVNTLRRILEDSVMKLRGEVSVMDAAAIQTAVKWERHGALAQRWLRTKGDSLKPNELLNFSQHIAEASTKRDRAIAMLRLNEKPAPLSLAEYVVKNGNTELVTENNEAEANGEGHPSGD